MKKAFFCLSGLLALAVPALAQTYDFVGLVQDGERGEVIGGVELSTPDGKKLGVSQSTGRFEVTVNNRRAHVIFRRQGYKDLDVDLGELPNLIDVEVSMESAVQELNEITTYTTRRSHDPNQAQSIEELESLQGMRIDLNDHLRQLHGVAGMNEFTNDISVNGSRTEDVTHYLGHSRIPSLRHLDFGFPGNQSVLNPRLLKSITLSDDLAKGPVNQGNASALVYDLREGDPEALHGDLVIGSVDEELNASGYWDGRTLLFSGRYLDPSTLSNLGSKFFTTPKDARLNNCNTCVTPPDLLKFNSLDLFFGTFLRDSTGAYSRHSLIIVDDDYNVQEDVGTIQNVDFVTKDTTSVGNSLVQGYQGATLYSYESVQPSAAGDWESGFSILYRDYQDAYHDTIPPTTIDLENRPWYLLGLNQTQTTDVDHLIGDGSRTDWQSIWSGQWSPSAKSFGAQPSYGLELEYHHQNRGFYDISDSTTQRTIVRDVAMGNALYRLNWNLPKKQGLEASLGLAWGYEGLLATGQTGTLTPLPLASLRYTHPLGENQKVFAEVSQRQLTDFEPEGYDQIKVKPTPSTEAMIGGDGGIGIPLRYAWSGYTHLYLNPALPVPDVFWNYAETRSSDYARVNGGNATLNWLPSHHAGLGVNGSVIQGAYHMTDGTSLPWESNRTLDVVSNLRILPRDDSALSIIFTYTVSNGRPLYEYDGLWDSTGTGSDAPNGHATNKLSVFQSSNFPEVSRKRLDMRINIDLRSHWRPLESMRFFFEADNVFADYNGTLGGWLGGTNERQRGWTRADDNGDLQPVVTRGLGLFIMFGLEGHIKI